MGQNKRIFRLMRMLVACSAVLLLSGCTILISNAANGLSDKAPEKPDEIVLWVSSILQLLRELGLMAPEESGS